jgi:hypothetical protein
LHQTVSDPIHKTEFLEGEEVESFVPLFMFRSREKLRLSPPIKWTKAAAKSHAS